MKIVALLLCAFFADAVFAQQSAAPVTAERLREIQSQLTHGKYPANLTQAEIDAYTIKQTYCQNLASVLDQLSGLVQMTQPEDAYKRLKNQFSSRGKAAIPDKMLKNIINRAFYEPGFPLGTGFEYQKAVVSTCMLDFRSDYSPLR